MAARKKLGEMLITEGLIDEMQLNSAIGHQRNWGGKLGSTLVELGFLTEDDISRVLEGQLKQKCLSDEDLVPTPQALDCVSAQDAFRYNILPIRVDDRMLELAMSNPYDLEITDAIELKLKKRVKGILAVESAIKRAIKRYYFGEETSIGNPYKAATAPRPDPSGKMEVIHDDRDMMAEQAATQSGAQTPSPAPAPVSPKVEPSAEVISKAVAYLLIEKGIIKRDELIEKMKQIHEKQGG
jgi:hypothetical protein